MVCAGQLALDVLDLLGARGHGECRPDALIERGAAFGGVGIALRERHGGQRGHVLHDPAEALFVGAQAVGHGNRGVDLAVAVARAGSAPISPVYQVTVSAGVPATNAVAVSNGGPATPGRLARIDVEEIAGRHHRRGCRSEVAASLPTAAVSAVSRLPAVRSLVAPMANWFGPGLADVVAGA